MENNKKDPIDSIDLTDLFRILWSERLIIILSTLSVSIIGVIYALSLPNIYTSKALLAPTQQEGGVNNALRSYGGLATLAGINLPSSSSGNVTEAIETLSSFKFFKDSFLPNIFLPDLIAVDSWNSDTNNVNYDNSLYNIDKNEWTSKDAIPSTQKAFKIFLGQISVSKDDSTGFITISANHQSPYKAQSWLETIIFSINQTLREDQKKRASLSIDYLYKQIAQTSYAEIKQQLSSLIQQETEKLMLIEANEDYIFKVIDPPIAPEEKSGPFRSIICIMAAFLGGMLGILIAVTRYFVSKNI